MDESERLNSWKEIAAHLSVSVRTAQRWEKTEHLPARRHQHAALGSVFAYRSELNAWWDSRPHLREAAAEPVSTPASIAVLPFANLSRDEATEIFCDGLTEELINALTQIEGLRVVARTSAFHFKGKTADIRTIAARLGVTNVLEGSVRRAGDRLRITAQLINAADGCHLWSERFNRRMADVFDVQEEISQSIVQALQVKLDPGRITRQFSRDLESYELYLQGRHHWNTRTGQGTLKAVECFERAVARDPRMASAWAALADCYAMWPAYVAASIDEAVRKVRIAAQKALDIDDRLAEPHTSLAFATAVYEYDWAGAEAGFLRALELNPNDANAHLFYAAAVLGPTGRLDESGSHHRRACELDPLSPVMLGALGTCSVMARQYDESIAACRRALELDPAYPWAHRSIGESCLMKGLDSEACEAFSKIESPAFAAGFQGYCLARSGRLPQARQLLQKLRAIANPMLAFQIAVLHLGLGERHAAFDWLHQAVDAHSMGVYWLKVEPIWDDLRRDARFTAVLRRLGVAD